MIIRITLRLPSRLFVPTLYFSHTCSTNTFILSNTLPLLPLFGHANIAARRAQSCVVLSNDAVLVLGGFDISGSNKNDVWKTVDGGANWILITSSAGWTGET